MSMYPNRHPPSAPPPSNPPNTKELIGELCERIKNEYSNMYSHIQNLRAELEKASTQRADYERYYSLNQDMSYLFNAEIHKMMEVIKRLVTACIQQVPFLPQELQQNCVHLIEQVKAYTNNEVPNTVFMSHGPHPPPGHHMPPPSQHSMQHHLSQQLPPPPPPPPSHCMGPPGLPSPMHSGPHMPMNHMMPYQNRMPHPPPPPGPHCGPDGRDQYLPHHPHLPHDSYRYMYGKDKECCPNMGSSESFNGVGGKERSRHSSMTGKYGPTSGPVVPYPYPKQSSSEQQNGGPEDQSPKEIQENESHSDKFEYSEAALQNRELTEDQASTSQNASPGSKCNSPDQTINQPKNQKPSESDSTPHKPRNPSPTNKLPKPEKSVPSSSSSRLNNFKPTGGPPQFPIPHRTPFNGNHMSDMPLPPPPNYPPMNMQPPYMRPSIPPSYDQMMMMRNSTPGSSYGPPILPYHVPPGPMSYPPYMGPDYNDNSYSTGPSAGSIPKSFNMITSLQHGDVVCCVTFSVPSRYAFTGSKGTVKIWDINEISTPKLVSSIDCLKENYVRACKSINDNKLLIISGENASIGLWNLAQNNGSLNATLTSELINPSPVCYDMAISKDEKNCYCCCSNGAIVGWDIEAQTIIRSFTGHIDGATCIGVTKDGNTMWSGGLDATTRCWDIREGKQVHQFTFPTQVFSLSISPTSDYLVVGLENKTIEMCYTKADPSRFGERHVFRVHESCVLTVKIANNGKWLISSSKDNYTNCLKMPHGMPMFMTRESASILSTDISKDDKYVISGGGEKKASIYECVYA